MNAKEYLSQAFTLHGLIKAKKSRIEQLRDMRESVAGGLQTGTRVQTSRVSDPIGEMTAKILEVEENCQRDITKLISVQREIEEVIESVINPSSRLILYERYINLKTWEDIAEDNHYSLKWVHVLHKRGLESAVEIIRYKNL